MLEKNIKSLVPSLWSRNCQRWRGLLSLPLGLTCSLLALLTLVLLPPNIPLLLLQWH